MKIKLIFLAILCVFISAQKHIGGELQDAGLERLETDPTTGLLEGRMYFNTVSKEMRIYDGSSWMTVAESNSNAVNGPSIATDNALARFDGATGKLLKDSQAQVSNTGEVLAGNGSLSNAGHSFIGSANSGMSWDSGSGQVYFTDNGESVLLLGSNFNQLSIPARGDRTAIDVKNNSVFRPTIRAEATASGVTLQAINNDSFRPTITAINRGDGSAGYFESDQGAFAPLQVIGECLGGELFGAPGDCTQGPNSTLLLIQNKSDQSPFHISMRNKSGNAFGFRIRNTTTQTQAWDSPAALPTTGQFLTASEVNGSTVTLGWTEPNQLSVETSAPVCGASERGQMVYADSDNVPCHCDGGGTWKKFSDDTACTF
jgi:hypothetical protein